MMLTWKNIAAQELDELANTSTDKNNSIYDQLNCMAKNKWILQTASIFAKSGTMLGLESIINGEIIIPRQSIRLRTDAIEWMMTQSMDRTSRWNLQAWMFLKDVTHTDFVNGNASVAFKAARPIITSWLNIALSQTAIENDELLIWHDHTTALRAIHAIYFLCLAIKNKINPIVVFPDLYKFVRMHIKILLCEDFYSKGTNHGFDQANALFLLSRVINLGALSIMGQEESKKRLIYEMKHAFSKDHVHLENSPGYHSMMMEKMIKSRALMKQFGHEVDDMDVDGIVDGGLRFLIAALKPDGTLPMLGDTETIQARKSFNELRALEIYSQYEYASTNGRIGSAPDNLDAIFPVSGYAFLRDKWPTPITSNDVIHLSLKCGFLSPYHRHDDDNHILVYAFGEDWLIDGGIYKYHEEDQYRKYFRSAASHNVATILGIPASRKMQKDDIRGIFNANFTANTAFVEASTQIYADFSYTRAVQLDRKSRAIHVSDWIKPKHMKLNTYQIRIHIPSDKTVSIFNSNTVIATSQITGNKMKIQSVSSQQIRIRTEIAQTEPSISGWTSPQIGLLIPAHTIVFEFVDQKELSSMIRFSWTT